MSSRHLRRRVRTAAVFLGPSSEYLLKSELQTCSTGMKTNRTTSDPAHAKHDTPF
jgi:hypothetical protein